MQLWAREWVGWTRPWYALAQGPSERRPLPFSPATPPYAHPALWAPLTQAQINYRPLQHQPLGRSEVALPWGP